MRTSNNTFINEVVYKTLSGEKSIQYRGEKLWHELPDETKVCDSFSIFKKQRKNQFFSESPFDSE